MRARPSKNMPEGDQRVVAEPAAQVLHPLGRRAGGVEVRADERGGLEVQRVAVLGALLGVVEQALCPGQPAVGLGAVAL